MIGLILFAVDIALATFLGYLMGTDVIWFRIRRQFNKDFKELMDLQRDGKISKEYIEKMGEKERTKFMHDIVELEGRVNAESELLAIGGKHEGKPRFKRWLYFHSPFTR